LHKITSCGNIFPADVPCQK